MKLYTELFSLDDHFHCKDPKLSVFLADMYLLRC